VHSDFPSSLCNRAILQSIVYQSLVLELLPVRKLGFTMGFVVVGGGVCNVTQSEVTTLQLGPPFMFGFSVTNSQYKLDGWNLLHFLFLSSFYCVKWCDRTSGEEKDTEI
jgi:hypothetical protein